MAKQEKSSHGEIIYNKKARFEYTIEKEWEVGLVLEGWEVKSLRAGRIQLVDSYVLLKNGAAWLFGAQIQPLPTASTHIQPDPIRNRKLLVHAHELKQWIGYIERQGYTLIPLSLYWSGKWVKAKIALAKGKKTHDQREAIKQREWQREHARIVKKEHR
ncbi:MAG TPA: SsrA-binding protein [Legionellales bacterium]|jgi:SsrA-binding protein|nr:SsrA-binding protein [Legionellales bacterium]